jgi:tetraacyldisaccharide 4'-kinase
LRLARVARWLESERARPAALRWLASIWGKASRVERPLAFARGVRAIGVGGATLGGSGKTPVAVALARALAERGERVALVGHAYRARPGAARVVGPNDDVRQVGDDALFAARVLAPFGAEVVVAPTRQSAIDLACRTSRQLVLDGVLQARPARLARSLLVVDGARPWGNGLHPPAGDLRASRDALLAAADLIAIVDGDPSANSVDLVSGRSSRVDDSRPSIGIHTRIERAIEPGGSPVTLDELACASFGLLLAIARPDRVVRSLEQRGLRAEASIDLGDHGAASPAALERAAAKKARVSAWLTTAKCATKLPPRLAGAPILTLDHRVEVPGALVDWALGA